MSTSTRPSVFGLHLEPPVDRGCERVADRPDLVGVVTDRPVAVVRFHEQDAGGRRGSGSARRGG